MRKGIVVGLVLLLGPTARALSPADKCESSELKTSGKYGFCRLKAEAKAVKSGGAPDFSKCDATFGDKFGKADTNGMGECPSSASQAAIQAFITQCTGDIATALGGGPLLTTQPPPLQTGQITAYGTGSDGDIQKGASRSYTDNGDGTITDRTTGLMWEKKSNDGMIHDWTNTYTWSGASYGTTYILDGTATTTFLATLNGGGGFAGHTDWRIPNVNELQSIINYGQWNPAVDPAFANCVGGCTVTMCSCTETTTGYWSSTTWTNSTQNAWGVGFGSGDVFPADKSGAGHVRAVRNAP